MKNRVWLILGIFLFVIPVRSESIPGNDIYVELYGQKVEIAAAQIEKQKAAVDYADWRYTMMEKLVEKQAASREELQIARMRLREAAAKLKELKARKGEADALLKLAISRAAVGREMPLCCNVSP